MGDRASTRHIQYGASVGDDMTRAVIKFGGASLATGERIHVAARMVANSSYDEKVIVVSASGRTTDQLLDLVSSFEERMDEMEYAEILSMGERTSAKVFLSALKAMGVNAVSLDPTSEDFPIITDANYLNAKVDLQATREACQRILTKWLGRSTVVVPGFVGRHGSHTTVLGRGGSDITATVLGNCLEADEVILVKDTQGVMSADPDVVPDARPIDRISIAETYALAQGGAKVVKPEALFYKGDKQRLRIVRFGCPLEEDGTEIVGSIHPTNPSFERKTGLSELTVVCESGLEVLSEVIGRLGVGVKGVGTGRTTITLFVYGTSWQELCQKAHGIRGIKAVSGRNGIGYVDIVHPRLVDEPGVVAKAATMLSLHGINIIEVTSSKGGLTFFLEDGLVDTAYRVLVENLVVG